MSAKTLTSEPAAHKPAAPTAPDAPEIETEATFPPSAELGDQLTRLEEAQAAIDRKQAEELARLRALQDRD